MEAFPRSECGVRREGLSSLRCVHPPTPPVSRSQAVTGSGRGRTPGQHRRRVATSGAVCHHRDEKTVARGAHSQAQIIASVNTGLAQRLPSCFV